MSLIKYKTEESMNTEINKILELMIDRLDDPERVKSKICSKDNTIMSNDIKFFPWGDLHLGMGYPSVALFLGHLERVYPTKNLEIYGHNYMLAISNQLQQTKIVHYGMWFGLAGIGMSVKSLSNEGKRYIRFTKNIENTMNSVIPNEIKRLDVRLSNKKISYSDYDLIEGLIGIGIYLLYSMNNNECTRNLKQIITHLIRVVKEVRTFGIKGENSINLSNILKNNGEEKDKYLDYGISHGIAGLLAFLAICIKKGVVVESQRDIVKYLAHWLESQVKKDALGYYWLHRLTLEDYVSEKSEYDREREAWCYGTPGVARAMFLAGEVLGDAKMKTFSVAAFKSIININDSVFKSLSPSFCHGLAGILQLSNKMYKDTDDLELLLFRNRILNILLDKKGDAPFVFKVLNGEGESAKLINNIGLLEGVTGIGLSLLSTVEQISPQCDSIFLLD